MPNLVKHTRRHDIVFHRSGLIDIMARIARAIGLAKGDVINIECRGGEYYLYVSIPASRRIGRHHGTCYPTCRGSHNFRARFPLLCRRMLDICHATDTAGFWCGDATDLGDGIIRIPVITQFNTTDCND